MNIDNNEVIIVNDNPIVREIINLIYYGRINKSLKYVCSGSFGDILSYKDYIIKIFYFDDDQNRDYEVLLALKDSPYFPTLFAYKPHSYMIVSKVKGIPGHSYKDDIDFKLLHTALREAESKGFIINNANEHNIIIDEMGKPIIVDVGDFIKVKDGKQLYYSSASRRIIL